MDDASGMVVSAIMERMGGKPKIFEDWGSILLNNTERCIGEGRLLTICDVDSPPAYPVMVNMNFKKEMHASTLVSLNWATAQEDYTPSRHSLSLKRLDD